MTGSVESARFALALIHSPLVGAGTWRPVAEELRRRGEAAFVPTLRDDPAREEPFWQQQARSTAGALAAAPPAPPLLLVAHSGAGALLPTIRLAMARPVAGYLFVDAGLPADGQTRLEMMASESPEFAGSLRAALEAGERFPAWRDEQLREIVPDPAARAELLAELRPRALPFFDEPIPAFAGWPDAPCGYLLFSQPYAGPAAQARAAGWPVREIAAGHFHMLVNPAGVADALLALATSLVKGVE